MVLRQIADEEPRLADRMIDGIRLLWLVLMAPAVPAFVLLSRCFGGPRAARPHLY